MPAQPIDEGVGVSDIAATTGGLPVQDNETALLDSGESRSQNIEITFPLADGRVKWIRFTQYLYSAEGESTIEGLVEDITELKQAELALREFNETLEERVRERTAELEEVNAQLESFTYSVSHDLRAPLRGISFFAEMLLKDKASELDATAQDYLYRINDAASLMNTLIENLLEYSRLSKANLPLKAVSDTFNPDNPRQSATI
ncbi:histidine kinase dimerization/phospho-acceptor domain-containing protein [Microcoleus sp. D3_18a_C4]